MLLLLVIAICEKIAESFAFTVAQSQHNQPQSSSRAAASRTRLPLLLFDSSNPNDISLAPQTSDVLCDLQTFLRLVDVVPTGGTAKLSIQAGECLLNGQVETKRAKKLFPGDVVTFDGCEYNVDEHVASSGYVYKPKRKKANKKRRKQ